MLARVFGICERYRVTTGQRLQRAIARKFGTKMSQGKVAEQLKVPKGTLSEWLNDKYEPRVQQLAAKPVEQVFEQVRTAARG